jgi:hypothetical protein
MANEQLANQLGRIQKELDGMISLLLDQSGHADVAGAIFAASTQVCRAEVLLKMKNLNEAQLKELGIKTSL